MITIIIISNELLFFYCYCNQCKRIHSSSCSIIFLPHPAASTTICIVVVADVMVAFYDANGRVNARFTTVIYLQNLFQFQFDLTFPIVLFYHDIGWSSPSSHLQLLALTDDSLSHPFLFSSVPTRSANLLSLLQTDGKVCSFVICCPCPVHLKLPTSIHSNRSYHHHWRRISPPEQQNYAQIHRFAEGELFYYIVLSFVPRRVIITSNLYFLVNLL